MEYLCSGTLLERRKMCGKPGCRCAQDPQARHGPYYEWGHMKAGKLVHRTVSPEQAASLGLPSPIIGKPRNLSKRGNTKLNGLSTPKPLATDLEITGKIMRIFNPQHAESKASRLPTQGAPAPGGAIGGVEGAEGD